MKEMRKLMESVEKIEEGYFKEQDIEHQEEALRWIKRNRTGEMDPSQITVLGRESFQASKTGELSKEAAEHVMKFVRKEHEDEEPRFPKQFGSQARWALDYAQKYGGTAVRLGVGDYVVKAKEENIEESEIEYLKYPEGYEPPELPERHPLDSFDWSMRAPDDVIQMMKSLEHKMKSQNVWDKGVELAGSEDQLWKEIQYEAEDIMDTYRDSGEGIGTSDMNHFVRSLFRQLGEDDIWGWDKPKEESIMKSDDEMERDKTNRAARFRNIGEDRMDPNDDSDDWLSNEEYMMIKRNMAERGHTPHSLGVWKGNLVAKDDLSPGQPEYTFSDDGQVINVEYMPGYEPNEQEMSADQQDWNLSSPFENIEEAEEDTWAGNFATYEDYEKWIGQTVKIERTISGEHVGETGKVVSGDKYRDENGSWQAEFEIKLHSGPVITMYPGEWSYDQFNLAYDPTIRPDGKYDPEIEEAVVEVPAGLRGEEAEVGGATSQDAEHFLSTLEPDDSVDTNVIDPESGELLDWPTKDERRKQDQAEREAEWDREEKLEREGIFGAPQFPSGSNDVERAWDGLEQLRFDHKINDFYEINWKSMEDLVDDPQQYYDGDYDVSYDMPVSIKRTDGEKFSDADHENFKRLNRLFRTATHNIGVSYSGVSDSGTVAHFYPSFY